LARLQQALDEAMTTPQINQATWDLAEYWLRQVAEFEDRIRKDLSGERLDAFNRSADLWRQYRNEHADMVYQMFKSGTIRGFRSNVARITLAEERLQLLLDLTPEGQDKG